MTICKGIIVLYLPTYRIEQRFLRCVIQQRHTSTAMIPHPGFAVPCGTHTLTIYPYYFIFLPPIIQSAHFATIEIKDYYRRKESGSNPRRQPLAVFSLNLNPISLNLIPSVHPHSFRERQKPGRQQQQPNLSNPADTLLQG